MEAIHLTILVLLAKGLGGTTTVNYKSSTGSDIVTDPSASSSLQDSSNLATATSWIITSMPTTISGPSSDLPSDTSILANTPSVTSQFTSKFSSEAQSIPSSTSKPTSYVATIKQTTTELTTSKPTTSKPTTSKPTTSKPTTSKPTTSKPTTSKPTTQYQDRDLAASTIVACIIGGILLLMLLIIVAIPVWKRCSQKKPVQDLTWAGTCPVPSGEDSVHVVEDNDIDAAPAKRPSLTTFLSKKSKRESLLDQYNMEVQESEGIINSSSPEIEGTIIVPAEVKMENETGKETQALSQTQTVNGTQSQDFPPPPLEAQAPLNNNDPQHPLPATVTEARGPPQGVPDVGPNNTNFPPPPLDFLDLVNDFDLPPPLSELEV
ncbi:uncharacterized protein [Heptranchias perlo]|uniref:uncharacterized protein n=1 Tax=Heptranchias perlo TaxID=212740 RepID=UPI00355A4C97